MKNILLIIGLALRAGAEDSNKLTELEVEKLRRVTLAVDLQEERLRAAVVERNSIVAVTCEARHIKAEECSIDSKTWMVSKIEKAVEGKAGVKPEEKKK